MVADWVAIRPIFEVCAKETEYEGGGRLREPWWWQADAEQQLKATLKEILEEARVVGTREERNSRYLVVKGE